MTETEPKIDMCHQLAVERRKNHDLDAMRLELGEAWREWLSVEYEFPTGRLLDAMSELLPDGFDLVQAND